MLARFTVSDEERGFRDHYLATTLETTRIALIAAVAHPVEAQGYGQQNKSFRFAGDSVDLLADSGGLPHRAPRLDDRARLLSALDGAGDTGG